METQKFSYDNGIVRAFLYATIVWGVLGFTFGVIVASMLFYPELPEFLFGTDDPTITSLKMETFKDLLIHKVHLALADGECFTQVP